MTDRIVHVVARLVPRPGKAEALATTLLEMLDEVRAEPGCLLYDAHESRDAPGVIVMVESWADQAALDAHGRALALTRLAARLDALLAEPPTIERLRRIG